MYTPPPDDPSRRSKYSDAEDSYQSGGVPGVSIAHGSDSVQEGTAQSQWETRYGWRVDILAAAAYVLGPFSEFARISTHHKAISRIFMSRSWAAWLSLGWRRNSKNAPNMYHYEPANIVACISIQNKCGIGVLSNFDS
ncbi:hypothetical protein D9613_001835 [Agrocybe pediades]|uniref:Uncharacterized protein n=1 Tax=Agrocybe pediades TaxID=84607 RepID=A0A8H4R6Q9_9AGAR|nr:hypothetical protein D9613_001835 [Agrocybe pediades]